MRKLIAALLVLPLIAAGTLHARGAGTERGADPAFDTVSAASAPLVQHALPGHAALSLAASLTLPGPAGADAWRNPGGPRAQPARSHAWTADARTHIGFLQRRRLAFARAVARAHASLPGTFGNPPPPLLT